MLQAASKIAKAASNNAVDDDYSSPYTAEAIKKGMDLPWWQKVSGARFKDGKVQLARLQVCAQHPFATLLVGDTTIAANLCVFSGRDHSLVQGDVRADFAFT